MRATSVRVRNFRCCADASIELDRLTALVGANGSGKSTLLRALELFYSPSPRVGPEDFYGENTNLEIEVEIVFSELDNWEKKQFASYVEGERLAVVRVFSTDAKASGKYRGSRFQNPAFDGVRKASSAAEKKEQYEALRQQPTYADLPKWSKTETAVATLAAWEGQNLSACGRQRDDGQFFGFTEVGQGYLGRSTRLISIPAVRDAADDASDTKSSPIGEVMELVVRSVLAQRAELLNFKNELQQKFEVLYAPENIAELKVLEAELSEVLSTYAPSAGVALGWLPPGEIQLPVPKASVKLVEDGYSAPVPKTGHGLQRAFILTMLQYLAHTKAKQSAQPGDPDATHEPTLILAIEEPELYQHPNRQRHLARVLASLASGSLPGVARQTQVVYCTHSPLFVGLDRFDQIRLFRKTDALPGEPRVTRVVGASLENVARDLWAVSELKSSPPFTADTLRPRLATLMTPWMNEGFFATAVVLVEGESDRAALLAAANVLATDLESSGVSVIPCGGKNSLDRPFAVFRALGIPVFMVWDNDRGGEDAGKASKQNRYLLRLLGQPEEDWPSKTGLTFAALPGKLETVLQQEIGADLFDSFCSPAKAKAGLANNDEALKNPIVVREILESAAKAGRRATTLEAIVNATLALVAKVATA